MQESVKGFVGLGLMGLAFLSNENFMRKYDTIKANLGECMAYLAHYGTSVTGNRCMNNVLVAGVIVAVALTWANGTHGPPKSCVSVVRRHSRAIAALDGEPT